MILMHNRGTSGVGYSAEVKDADGIIAGQIVKLSRKGEDDFYAEKTVSGDTADCEWGIAYIDITTNSQKIFYNTSTTSREWDKVAKGGRIAVIRGADLDFDTDQITDGNYPLFTALTVDFENACLKRKAVSDTKYGTITRPGVVDTDSDSNKTGRVRVKLSTTA